RPSRETGTALVLGRRFLSRPRRSASRSARCPRSANTMRMRARSTSGGRPYTGWKLCARCCATSSTAPALPARGSPRCQMPTKSHVRWAKYPTTVTFSRSAPTSKSASKVTVGARGVKWGRVQKARLVPDVSNRPLEYLLRAFAVLPQQHHPAGRVLQHVRHGLAEVELAEPLLVGQTHHDQVCTPLDRLVDKGRPRVACLHQFRLDDHLE